MLSQRFVSLLPTSRSFVLLQKTKQKNKSQRPESYLDRRGDGCFLVSHAGRRDDDRVLQSNEAKKMPRTKAMEEIAGLMRAKGFGVTAVK